MQGRVLALVGDNESPTTPNAAARVVRNYLTYLRKQAGLRQSDVVGKVPGIGSTATLCRYETAAKRKLDEETVVALCQFYGASPEIIDEILLLVQQSLQRAWWSSYADVVGDVLARVFATEVVSKSICTYQEFNVPGMLQTAAYARALMEDYYRLPADEATRRRNEELVSRRLDVRRQRQNLLDQPDAPEFQALIAESVLAKRVGGTAVMREQLRHLFNLAENKPNVHIRILPNAAQEQGGARHPSMTLFKPHDGVEGRMVYLENTNRGGEYLVDPSEVEPYQACMDDLWTRTGRKDETLDLLQDYIDRLVDPR
ncbi:helix-turn-helix transcriptional regulator [Streptomyces sp. JJ38]|uniref:helix-turn-helix domain-containing protein n=1 Tax=Streptomyces sp. JJ38 TaxID=2738128 RepID=UPI001C585078|nr:helix-turn-helix transcriptional regulator [Streptomyces sp. JJ38]MBW1597288.1 helix-turn-helix domain-containing protein [Streptomyces sp. JJ38]